MPIFVKRRALLVKREVTPGVDSLPVAATDGVLLRSLDVVPIEINTVDRTLVRAFFGAFQQITVGKMVKITAELEVAGFGTAGPATPTPGYDTLLRICGHSRTIVATVPGPPVVPGRVDYRPISTGFDAATIYFYQDGTLHRAVCCRGEMSMELNLDQIPVYKFEIMGLYAGVPTDTAMVTPTLTAYQTPLAVGASNTTLAKFLGANATGIALQSLSVKLGNNLVYRDLVNTDELVRLVNRQTTGSFTIEAPMLAERDVYSLVLNNTLTSIDITHGTVVGNRVRFVSDFVQVVNPKFSESDEIVMLSGDLRFVPSTAGNDEYTLTVQ